MSAPYVPGRDGRFYHADDAVAHIEGRNCSLGCMHGAKTDTEAADAGPGGTCELLALIFFSEEPIPDLVDHGTHITCTRRALQAEALPLELS